MAAEVAAAVKKKQREMDELTAAGEEHRIKWQKIRAEEAARWQEKERARQIEEALFQWRLEQARLTGKDPGVTNPLD